MWFETAVPGLDYDKIEKKERTITAVSHTAPTPFSSSPRY